MPAETVAENSRQFRYFGDGGSCHIHSSFPLFIQRFHISRIVDFTSRHAITKQLLHSQRIKWIILSNTKTRTK